MISFCQMQVYFEDEYIKTIYEKGCLDINQNYLREIAFIIFEMQCGNQLSDIIGEENFNNKKYAIRSDMRVNCKYGPDLVYCIDMNSENEYCIFIKGFDEKREE